MRYEPCTSIGDTQQILEQRLTNVDFETNPPAEILPHRAAYFRSFPLLDSVVLNKEPAQRCVTIETQSQRSNPSLSNLLIFAHLFYASYVVYFGKRHFSIMISIMISIKRRSQSESASSLIS